jgi:hypothetical protein
MFIHNETSTSPEGKEQVNSHQSFLSCVIVPMWYYPQQTHPAFWMTPDHSSSRSAAMPEPGTKRIKRVKLRPINHDDTSSSWSFGQWLVLLMIVVAVLCMVIGIILHGFPGWPMLAIVGCLVSGIGFVAIGIVAEFAWIEWIIGFADGIISGISGWFWTEHLGTWSENIGERGASVLWLLFGIPTFICGCLMALRIIPVW